MLWVLSHYLGKNVGILNGISFAEVMLTIPNVFSIHYDAYTVPYYMFIDAKGWWRLRVETAVMTR